MHKFLRAIGFSQFDTRKKVQSLVRACVLDATEKTFTENGQDTMLAEYCKEVLKMRFLSFSGKMQSQKQQ